MTLRRELPVWRSLMYCPVNVERFVAKAHLRGADAIQLDLEDAVAPSEKEAARRLVPAVAERVGRAGADVLVRINRPWRLALRDIEASVSPPVAGLVLPKIMSADHVRLIAELVDELEAERGLPHGHTKFITMVETAEGLVNLYDIPKASPRVVGLVVGGEDMALSLGMEPRADGLRVPKMQGLVAARAAGVLPLGYVGTVADYKDLEAFRAIVRESRQLGFLGGSAVHPGQVPILNEEHTPKPEDVARARRMIAVYDEAHAKGIGAVEFEGKMIDVPVVERARDLLARYEAIRAREARMAAARG